MNKYQEALDNVYIELKRRPTILESILLKTSHPMLQELVDKTKPMLVSERNKCPKCGCAIDIEYNYYICSNDGCGQYVDWSKYETTKMG